MTLIGVLCRDRPEGLRACLRGIARAGAPHRVVLHLDEPEPEVRELAESSGHELLISEDRIGIGASLNRLLTLRRDGEHFCRLDSDTEVETEGWLGLMLPMLERWATLGTVLRLWEGQFSRVGVRPGEKVTAARMGRGCGSVMLCPADVCERLGGFREQMPYAFEDSDWYIRVRQVYGRQRPAGTDLRVLAREAAPRSRKMWGTEVRVMDREYVMARKAFFREFHPDYRPIRTLV